MTLDKTHATYFFDLGLRYEQLGENYEAARHFLTAVTIAPSWAEARYHLGMAYSGMKQREDALEQHRQLKDLDTDLARKLYSFITSH